MPSLKYVFTNYDKEIRTAAKWGIGASLLFPSLPLAAAGLAGAAAAAYGCYALTKYAVIPGGRKTFELIQQAASKPPSPEPEPEPEPPMPREQALKELMDWGKENYDIEVRAIHDANLDEFTKQLVLEEAQQRYLKHLKNSLSFTHNPNNLGHPLPPPQ